MQCCVCKKAPVAFRCLCGCRGVFCSEQCAYVTWDEPLGEHSDVYVGALFPGLEDEEDVEPFDCAHHESDRLELGELILSDSVVLVGSQQKKLLGDEFAEVFGDDIVAAVCDEAAATLHSKRKWITEIAIGNMILYTVRYTGGERDEFELKPEYFILVRNLGKQVFLKERDRLERCRKFYAMSKPEQRAATLEIRRQRQERQAKKPKVAYPPPADVPMPQAPPAEGTQSRKRKPGPPLVPVTPPPKKRTGDGGDREKATTARWDDLTTLVTTGKSYTEDDATKWKSLVDSWNKEKQEKIMELTCLYNWTEADATRAVEEAAEKAAAALGNMSRISDFNAANDLVLKAIREVTFLQVVAFAEPIVMDLDSPSSGPLPAKPQPQSRASSTKPAPLFRVPPPRPEIIEISDDEEEERKKGKVVEPALAHESPPFEQDLLEVEKEAPKKEKSAGPKEESPRSDSGVLDFDLLAEIESKSADEPVKVPTVAQHTKSQTPEAAPALQEERSPTTPEVAPAEHGEEEQKEKPKAPKKAEKTRVMGVKSARTCSWEGENLYHAQNLVKWIRSQQISPMTHHTMDKVFKSTNKTKLIDTLAAVNVYEVTDDDIAAQSKLKEEEDAQGIDQKDRKSIPILGPKQGKWALRATKLGIVLHPRGKDDYRELEIGLVKKAREAERCIELEHDMNIPTTIFAHARYGDMRLLDLDDKDVAADRLGDCATAALRELRKLVHAGPPAGISAEKAEAWRARDKFLKALIEIPPRSQHQVGVEGDAIKIKIRASDDDTDDVWLLDVPLIYIAVLRLLAEAVADEQGKFEDAFVALLKSSAKTSKNPEGMLENGVLWAKKHWSYDDETFARMARLANRIKAVGFVFKPLRKFLFPENATLLHGIEVKLPPGLIHELLPRKEKKHKGFIREDAKGTVTTVTLDDLLRLPYMPSPIWEFINSDPEIQQIFEHARNFSPALEKGLKDRDAVFMAAFFPKYLYPARELSEKRVDEVLALTDEQAAQEEKEWNAKYENSFFPSPIETADPRGSIEWLQKELREFYRAVTARELYAVDSGGCITRLEKKWALVRASAAAAAVNRAEGDVKSALLAEFHTSIDTMGWSDKTALIKTKLDDVVHDAIASDRPLHYVRVLSTEASGAASLPPDAKTTAVENSLNQLTQDILLSRGSGALINRIKTEADILLSESTSDAMLGVVVKSNALAKTIKAVIGEARVLIDAAIGTTAPCGNILYLTTSIEQIFTALAENCIANDVDAAVRDVIDYAVMLADPLIDRAKEKFEAEFKPGSIHRYAQEWKDIQDSTIATMRGKSKERTMEDLFDAIPVLQAYDEGKAVWDKYNDDSGGIQHRFMYWDEEIRHGIETYMESRITERVKETSKELRKKWKAERLLTRKDRANWEATWFPTVLTSSESTMLKLAVEHLREAAHIQAVHETMSDIANFIKIAAPGAHRYITKRNEWIGVMSACMRVKNVNRKEAMLTVLRELHVNMYAFLVSTEGTTALVMATVSGESNLAEDSREWAKEIARNKAAMEETAEERTLAFEARVEGTKKVDYEKIPGEETKVMGDVLDEPEEAEHAEEEDQALDIVADIAAHIAINITLLFLDWLDMIVAIETMEREHNVPPGSSPVCLGSYKAKQKSSLALIKQLRIKDRSDADVIELVTRLELAQHNAVAARNAANFSAEEARVYVKLLDDIIAKQRLKKRHNRELKNLREPVDREQEAKLTAAIGDLDAEIQKLEEERGVEDEKGPFGLGLAQRPTAEEDLNIALLDYRNAKAARDACDVFISDMKKLDNDLLSGAASRGACIKNMSDRFAACMTLMAVFYEILGLSTGRGFGLKFEDDPDGKNAAYPDIRKLESEEGETEDVRETPSAFQGIGYLVTAIVGLTPTLLMGIGTALVEKDMPIYDYHLYLYEKDAPHPSVLPPIPDAATTLKLPQPTTVLSSSACSMCGAELAESACCDRCCAPMCGANCFVGHVCPF